MVCPWLSRASKQAMSGTALSKQFWQKEPVHRFLRQVATALCNVMRFSLVSQASSHSSRLSPTAQRPCWSQGGARTGVLNNSEYLLRPDG